MRLEVLFCMFLAFSPVLAGGDPGKVHKLPCDGVTTAVAEGVKVKCGPCVLSDPLDPTSKCADPCPAVPPCPPYECPDCRLECGDCPWPSVPGPDTMDNREPTPRGLWFVPLSAFYLDDPGIGAGIGYQWRNRVTLSGQLLYRLADDSWYQCPDVGGKKCLRPGPSFDCQRGRRGVIATLTIPIGR